MIEIYEHPKLQTFFNNEGMKFDGVFIDEETPYSIYGVIYLENDELEINLSPEKMGILRNLIEEAELKDLLQYE